MADKPKPYHRTLVTVEVITDKPLEFANLEDLNTQLTLGDAVGKARIFTTEQIDRPTMRKTLAAQGHDPNFFDNGDAYDDNDGLVAPIHWYRDPDA